MRRKRVCPVCGEDKRYGESCGCPPPVLVFSDDRAKETAEPVGADCGGKEKHSMDIIQLGGVIVNG